jgi:hypothetical protein
VRPYAREAPVSTGVPPAPYSAGDVVAAAVALALVAVAVVVGRLASVAGLTSPGLATPLFAHWLPHAGPGTPVALGAAAVVVWHGPSLAAWLPWRRLLVLSYAAAFGWTLSLALVDGWQAGVAARLTNPNEYLRSVPPDGSIPAMLDGFVARIAEGQPDSWPPHVAGHPPGALLVFVLLDRIGLGGGGWAGVVCIAVGSLAAVAVAVTVRSAYGDATARAAVPFLVLFPGAVWVGVSADGMFAGVTACGLALLAVGRQASAVAGGALLGFGCFLSYGLVLLAPAALAVVLLTRRVRMLPWASLGLVCVVAAFTASGAGWLDGYRALSERYHAGIAADRPYGYWVWANLACLALAAGPAAAAIVRRTVLCRTYAPSRVLPAAALVAIAVADLSGMSKAEVERIWLPFTVWLMAGAVLLPASTRRMWLAGQALTALAVNHLLFTAW